MITTSNSDHYNWFRTALHGPDQAALFRNPPPGRQQLTAASKFKTVGREIVASNSTKVAAGVLIGLGIAFSFTGCGIGLVAVGACLWFLSTALSTHGLENQGALSVARHLAWSFMLGVAGAGTGLVNIGAGAACLATVPKLLGIATGLEVLAAAGPISDLFNLINFSLIKGSGQMQQPDNDPATDTDEDDLPVLTDRYSHVLDDDLSHLVDYAVSAIWDSQGVQIRPAQQRGWAPEPSDPGLIKNINDILAGLFSENQSEVTRYEPVSGAKVALRMDEGLDLITYESVSSKMNAEWIAVLRRADPAIYDVMLSSTYEKLMTKNSTRMAAGEHPTTRTRIADCLTVRGQELLTLLETTSPPVIAT